MPAGLIRVVAIIRILLMGLMAQGLIFRLYLAKIFSASLVTAAATGLPEQGMAAGEHKKGRM